MPVIPKKKTTVEPAPPVNQTLELVKRLTQAPGPSGYERRAALVTKQELARFADEVSIDKVGSVVALKKGAQKGADRKKILLAAHLDEIGLLITAIEPGGFLRFTQIGGFDARVLLGQEVYVHPVSKKGVATDVQYPGIIGAKPPHFQSAAESEAVIPMQDLYIDVGMDAAQIKTKITVGDIAAIRAPFVTLKNDRAAGKAMDDRACVAVLVKTLEYLQKVNHTWDVYAVASVQEEVGLACLGALTSTYNVRPDIGIAVDGTHADMPLAQDYETCQMGKGPAIAMGPNLHPAVVDKLKDVAKKEEIPYQLEPVPGITGTDAMDIQIAVDGVPTGLVSPPLRYMHTPVETIAAADIERAGRLLARFIQEVDDIKLEWKDD
ncbi:MAG: M42 family metallopeptidase [Candidatus Edwardsbacteria bacterium]|nr:M42 family metallopeptidase [Candidatus Edwardsbacteria bacterium]